MTRIQNQFLKEKRLEQFDHSKLEIIHLWSTTSENYTIKKGGLSLILLFVASILLLGTIKFLVCWDLTAQGKQH